MKASNSSTLPAKGLIIEAASFMRSIELIVKLLLIIIGLSNKGLSSVLIFLMSSDRERSSGLESLLTS